MWTLRRLGIDPAPKQREEIGQKNPLFLSHDATPNKSRLLPLEPPGWPHNAMSGAGGLKRRVFAVVLFAVALTLLTLRQAEETNPSSTALHVFGDSQVPPATPLSSSLGGSPAYPESHHVLEDVQSSLRGFLDGVELHLTAGTVVDAQVRDLRCSTVAVPSPVSLFTSMTYAYTDEWTLVYCRRAVPLLTCTHSHFRRRHRRCRCRRRHRRRRRPSRLLTRRYRPMSTGAPPQLRALA